MPYSYLSFAAAVTELASRLQDYPAPPVYWNQPDELLNCLIEAVRLFNALTGSYKARMAFPTIANQVYYDLPSQPGSPIPYTVTDVEVANNVLAALLEPPITYPTWVGTGQFTLAQLQDALQNRLNRFLSDTGCTVTQRTIAGPTPPSDIAPLPEGTSDVRRAAWIPLGAGASSYRIFVDQITPAGAQNGFNRVFTLPQAPDPPQSLVLILNGVTLAQGSDYTLSGATITFLLGATIPDPTTLSFLAWYRYFGVTPAGGTGVYPLGRLDEWAEQAYMPAAIQNPDQPISYSVFGVGPQQIRAVPPPVNEGSMDLLLVLSGPALSLNPTSPVLLGVPDDLSPALKWGVLADLLGSDGPSRDYARAAYCEQRYAEFVQIALVYPSVMTADVNNITCGVGSVFDMDSYLAEWQYTVGEPSFVGMCGRNMACVGVTPDGTYGIGLWLCANMPTSGYVQIGRGQIDPVLDYAQHIASFKMAGAEFDGTTRLYQNLIECAKSQNGRLSAVAFYKGQLDQPAAKSELEVARVVR